MNAGSMASASASGAVKRPASTALDGAEPADDGGGGRGEGSSADSPQEMEVLLDVAIRAVTHASRIATAVQARRRESGAGGTIAKPDTSPVTVADYAVQCLITEYLATVTRTGSSLRLVAEEDAELLNEHSRAAEAQEVTDLLNKHFPFDEVACLSTPSCGAEASQRPRRRHPFDKEDVFGLLRQGCDVGGRSGMFWVLDPIDGTKGFIRDAQYAIGLGLVLDGQVALGAMASPNLPAMGGDVTHRSRDGGMVFAAIVGEGTSAAASRTGGDDGGPPGSRWAGALSLEDCLRELEAPRGGCTSCGSRPLGRSWRSVFEPLRVAPSGPLEMGVMCESYELANANNNPLRCRSERLLAMRDVRLDSMSKYGLVARGEAHLYLRGTLASVRPESIWDHCAGVPLVLAAGGKVTDLRGLPLDFGTGRKLTNNIGVVATNGSIHTDTIEEIRKASESLAASVAATAATPAAAAQKPAPLGVAGAGAR